MRDSAPRTRGGGEGVDQVRLAAVRALCRVGREGGFAAKVEEFFSRRDASPLDRAFFQETAYGVLRHRTRLDRIISSFLRRDIASLPVPILNTLRLGAYQILFMSKVPASAAVNESVSIAKMLGHEGTAGLVNAVLRQVAARGRDVPGVALNSGEVPSLAAEYSHPEWLVERWVKRYGQEKTESLLVADNEIPPLTLRVNALRGTKEMVIERLRSEGVGVEASRVSPVGLRVVEGNPLATAAFREGLFTVQDESAQLVSLLVDPKPGQKVLDLCSAPGGKTTHLAEMMGDSGTVVAIDSHGQRLLMVTETAERLGLGSVVTMKADASRPIPGFPPDMADRVLVDAPCSGLGVLRRHPEARWEKREEDLPRFRERQSAILENAVSCLVEGGVLVYATCSTEPEENDAVISVFLDKFPYMRVDSPVPFLPANAEGLVREGLYLDTAGNGFGMDAFFAVRMVREE